METGMLARLLHFALSWFVSFLTPEILTPLVNLPISVVAISFLCVEAYIHTCLMRPSLYDYSICLAARLFRRSFPFGVSTKGLASPGYLYLYPATRRLGGANARLSIDIRFYSNSFCLEACRRLGRTCRLKDAGSCTVVASDVSFEYRSAYGCE
jgi:hypothetical protein